MSAHTQLLSIPENKREALQSLVTSSLWDACPYMALGVLSNFVAWEKFTPSNCGRGNCAFISIHTVMMQHFTGLRCILLLLDNMHWAQRTLFTIAVQTFPCQSYSFFTSLWINKLSPKHSNENVWFPRLYQDKNAVIEWFPYCSWHAGRWRINILLAAKQVSTTRTSCTSMAFPSCYIYHFKTNMWHLI